MNNNSQNDIFSPFRQSATAMSASLLLIIIAITNKLAFWALFVAILSLILSFTILFSCFIKLFTKLNKFTDFVFKLTDQLTYIFILISLVSIIKSLSAIVNLLISSGNKTSPQNLALMRPLSYWTVLIWLCFFGIVFIISAILYIIRAINIDRQTMVPKLITVTVYTLGVIGIATYANWFHNLIILFTSIFLLIIYIIYYFYYKNKYKSISPHLLPSYMYKIDQFT